MFHNFLISYLLQILDQRRREKSGGNCLIQRDGRLTWTNQNNVVFIVHSVKNTILKKNFILISISWLKDQLEQVPPLKEIGNYKTTFSLWIICPLYLLLYFSLADMIIKKMKERRKERKVILPKDVVFSFPFCNWPLDHYCACWFTQHPCIFCDNGHL